MARIGPEDRRGSPRRAAANDPLIPAREYADYRNAMIEYLDARQGWIVLRADHD